MVSALISRFVILIFGTLYPAYASYKAIRTKNVKEYVKWMMYWIVFAFFTTFETFADGLLSWLPFYYEIKIVFVLWLLSPITKGSSFLYRKFVHPQLTKREKEIDEYISQARNKGYTTVLQLGSRGFSYATNVILQTAIQGQSKLVSHLRRSYSMSDISSDLQDQRSPDRRDRSLSIPESEDELDNRLIEDNEELEKRALKKEALSQLDDEGDNLATSHKTELYSVPEESIMEPAAASKIYDQDITRKYHGYFGSLRGYDLRSYSKKEQNNISAYGTLPRRSRIRKSVKNYF